jgi:hypothetical protein
MAGRHLDDVDLGIVLGAARRNPNGHVLAIRRDGDVRKGVLSLDPIR